MLRNIAVHQKNIKNLVNEIFKVQMMLHLKSWKSFLLLKQVCMTFATTIRFRSSRLKVFCKKSRLATLLKRNSSTGVYLRLTTYFYRTPLVAVSVVSEKRANALWHDTESESYLGSKIWDAVPKEIEQSETLWKAFKSKIKISVPEGYSCRIILGKWGLKVKNWALRKKSENIITIISYLLYTFRS